MEENIELLDESKTSPLHTVVETVTTIGTQVKEQVSKVIETKLGRSSSYYALEDERSEKLLNDRNPQRASYGSFPSTSKIPIGILASPDAINTMKSEEKIRNDYYLENVPTLPSIPVQTYPPPGKPQLPNYYSHTTPFLSTKQDHNLLSVVTSDCVKTQEDKGFDFDKSSGELVSTMHSTSHTNTHEDSSNSDDHDEEEKFTWARWLKIGLVIGVFLAAATAITINSEDRLQFIQISASHDAPFLFPLKHIIPFSPAYPLLTVSLNGAFSPPQLANTTTDFLKVSVHRVDIDDNSSEIVSEVWEIPIFAESLRREPETTLSHTFSLRNISELFYNAEEDERFSLIFESSTDLSFPMLLSIKLLPMLTENGAMLGGLVIIGLYVLIIFELINRTLSAMLAATAAIGILSIFHERPTMEEMVSWLDMETLILLFAMMVMVSIVCETGFFNYCAYLMYKVTKGEIWPMITALCMFTAVVSAFLDNVTTILLMTPVTIRIAEAMRLNPVPVLISTVIFSNIGGAATPVGDPPNVIIANNPDVIKAGIDFTSFVTHMLVGIIPVTIVSYIQLRITFRSMKSLQFEVPYEIAELKREIEVWTRAVGSLSSYSRDESLVKAILESKILHLKSELKMKKKMGGQTKEGYEATLLELEETCRIQNWPLLIKCGVVLSCVILLFFIHSIPQLNLSMGWTALLGAVLLLILADRKELEGIFSRVEWSTLIFFSALFIVMESVSKLGLLDWIGNQTEEVILHVNPDSRTIVAILIILWVSGIASAFIDNIPFTTMMVQIVTKLASSLQLPLNPLIWALAFGTCLGGNGTLIGASANVVCAGVADQHGYRFSFVQYFRIGFPMMIVSLIVASAYLTIAYYIGFY
ncbi:unnamed protein product [Orchesella dallaii]|uniref:Citrate transporter-like domain-containing protein n=1 Tax=Orchesella dallaii TaxID=48710 RepID=A0ABP1PXG9_9HEXA